MMRSVLKLLKRNLIEFLIGKPMVFETFKDYNLASQNTFNYEEDVLLKVLIQKTKKYKESLLISNELNINEMRNIYALSKLGSKESINVLDFGGGAGGHYFFAKNYLDKNIKINWTIVETNKLVSMVKNEGFESEELIFVNDLSKVNILEEFDLIYANSSLPYTDNPTYYLESLLKFKSRYLYITRTPLNDHGDESIIALQVSKLSSNGPGEFKNLSKIEDVEIKYPVTIMGKNIFEKILSKSGKILISFIEEKNVYKTDSGNFHNFGYLVELSEST